MQANIGDAADRQKIVDAALAAFGRVDVLVNNAGVAPKVRADLLDMTEESFDYVVGVNTKGNMFLTQAVARQMIRQQPLDGRRGVIDVYKRQDIPTVMLTGGYMAAGHYKGRMLTLTHTKQAYAAYVAGDMSEEDYKGVVRNACPTPGACPFMGTANTMCAMAEILGFAPHGNASCRSQTEKWHELARQAARGVMEAWKNKVRPSDIIGQESFENVVRYMMATGGSTNSVLHIPALARQVGCDITPETFDDISRQVPVISTIYPNHPTYTMEEFLSLIHI